MIARIVAWVIFHLQWQNKKSFWQSSNSFVVDENRPYMLTIDYWFWHDKYEIKHFTVSLMGLSWELDSQYTSNNRWPV